MTGPGTLYGVSLGPGDPGLITRRAWDLLCRDDLRWTYPIRAAGAESFALGIALAAGRSPPPDSEALVFPMTRDSAVLAQARRDAAQRVLALLGDRTDLLFLVEGDASTYSSFGHLARVVRALAPATRIETVAGVTSFSASAAALGLPLADGDERIAILPAGYGVAAVERLMAQVDRLVLLKVRPLLDELIDLLERRGIIAQAVFCERIGTAQERIVHDLAALRGRPVDYLSLLLVRNPRRDDEAGPADRHPDASAP